MIEKSLIQKLHAAGVPPDVILQLVLDDDTPSAQAEQAAQDPAPAQAQTAPADPAPAAIPQGDAILQAINRLTGSIQAMNIRGIGGTTPPAPPTAHDALSYMLNSGAPEKGA